MERLPPRTLIPKSKWGKEAPIIQFIIDSEAYQSITTFREQCHIFAQLGHSHFLSNNKLVSILGCDHKTFENQLKLPLEHHPPGRPTILTEMEQLAFFDLINEYI